MRKAKARWSCDLWVNCPYCSEFQEIDLLAVDDCQDELGDICKSTQDLEHIHKCDTCGAEFMVDRTEW